MKRPLPGFDNTAIRAFADSVAPAVDRSRERYPDLNLQAFLEPDRATGAECLKIIAMPIHARDPKMTFLIVEHDADAKCFMGHTPGLGMVIRIPTSVAHVARTLNNLDLEAA